MAQTNKLHRAIQLLVLTMHRIWSHAQFIHLFLLIAQFGFVDGIQANSLKTPQETPEMLFAKTETVSDES